MKTQHYIGIAIFLFLISLSSVHATTESAGILPPSTLSSGQQGIYGWEFRNLANYTVQIFNFTVSDSAPKYYLYNSSTCGNIGESLQNGTITGGVANLTGSVYLVNGSCMIILFGDVSGVGFNQFYSGYTYNVSNSTIRWRARWLDDLPAPFNVPRMSNGVYIESGYLVGFAIVVPTPPTANVTFVSQTPSDITSTTPFSYPNVSIVYNTSNVGLTNAYLNYTVRSSVQSCIESINGSCVLLNNTVQYANVSDNTTSGNFTLERYALTENTIFPLRANYDYRTITGGYVNVSLGNNEVFADEILNISNLTAQNIYEVPLLTSVGGIARVYYYNSSYDFASAITTNANVQELCVYTNQTTFNHTHANGTLGHNLCVFAINTTTGKTGTVQVNGGGFLVARVSGTTTLQTITTSVRTNSGRTSANNGLTWSSANTLGSHLHQLSNTSYITYNAWANYSGSLQNGTPQTDTYDLDPISPQAPVITIPFGETNYTKFINITYGSAQSTIGTPIGYYLIKLLNNDTSLNATIHNNSVNLSYLWNTYDYNLTVGQTYYIQVEAYTNGTGAFADDVESFAVRTNAQLNISGMDASTNTSISDFNITLDDLNESTQTNYTGTGTIVSADIIRGHTYNISLDNPSYARTSETYISNTSNYQNTTIEAYKTNSVNIFVYDESTVTLITNVTTGGQTNITFTSNTSSFTNSTNTGELFLYNITEGYYEVEFSAPAYSQRSYFITVTNRSTQTLNAYLTQSAITLLLTYVDTETGELLEGCGVVVAKVVNGSWTTVATGFTDITGRVQFSVSTSTNYRFSSTCAGYEDKTFNLNPVIFTSYTVRLTQDAVIGSELDFTNINIYIPNTRFFNNDTNTFIFQISAPGGSLESFGYTLNASCSNVTRYSGTNAYGGTDTQNINLSCASTSDAVQLYYNYTLSGGEVREFNYQYPIYGPVTTNATAWTSNNDQTYGMGMFERALITVLITIVMAGLITKFSNIVAGLGVGLFVMGYLAYIGFIEWWLIAPTLLVGFVLLTAFSTSR